MFIATKVATNIRQWLEGLGLSRYADAFEANDIGPDLLPQISDQVLKDIGVASAGHRLRILTSISQSAAGRSPVRAVDAAAPPAERNDGERRQATVLVADISGYTAFLVGTGLFTVSLWKALNVDFGQETDHTNVVRADFADDGRPAAAQAAHRRIQAHLQTLPGVTAVAMVQGAP